MAFPPFTDYQEAFSSPLPLSPTRTQHGISSVYGLSRSIFLSITALTNSYPAWHFLRLRTIKKHFPLHYHSHQLVPSMAFPPFTDYREAFSSPLPLSPTRTRHGISSVYGLSRSIFLSITILPPPPSSSSSTPWRTLNTQGWVLYHIPFYISSSANNSYLPLLPLLPNISVLRSGFFIIFPSTYHLLLTSIDLLYLCTHISVLSLRYSYLRPQEQYHSSLISFAIPPHLFHP
ncbi:hypothetical protein EV424DRAFT_1541381 [Suillus variegatus]|nr:hypothetical protein EV424DRAFT_1541381 [Suillus variegatus]